MKLNILLVFFISFFSVNSYAFKFSPMSSTIGIKENENSALYFLENESDQPIAVQISLTKREMDINGVEANPKIKDELSVYPTQLIIPANEKRSVKVFWKAKEKPTTELAFRLIAEQLPIELEKNKNKKASIKVLLRYIAALYVKADDFSSDVKIKDFKADDKVVTLKIENSGKKHQVLTNLSLLFLNEKKKKEIRVDAENLKGMTGENILAGSERIFILPKLDKLLEVNSSDKVKINFDKD